MLTLNTISANDGECWSLEEQDGEYYLLHTMDATQPGPLATIPVSVQVLERFAAAIRGFEGVILDDAQNVIVFPGRRAA